MKLKFSLFIGLLMFCVAAQAQTIVGNSVQIYNQMTLKGKKITGFSNDTTLTGNDSTKLPTEFAVRGYVDNKIGGYTMAVGHTYVVPSQDSMLNVAANIGDVAVIPDSSKSYILKTQPATSFSNWVLIITPAQVVSAFGRTGNITAQYGDYDYSQIKNTPEIPQQFNPIEGANMTISGTYPNLIFDGLQLRVDAWHTPIGGTSWFPNQAIVLDSHNQSTAVQFPQNSFFPKLKSGDVVELYSTGGIDTLQLQLGGHGFPKTIYDFKAGGLLRYVYNNADSTWYGGYTADYYGKGAADSITAELRSEIQVAAAGGITKAQLDSAANLKLNITDSLNPSHIVQTSVYRFVTDADKSNWNGKMDTVQNIASLQNYTGNSKVILVTDTIRGGFFIKSTSGVPDNGVVFTGTSGYWVRQYDKAKGVNVDWWGSTDVAINAAINYVGPSGILNFTPNKTYLLSNQLNALSGQIWNGNGATLKRADDSVVVLTASVLSTDSSFTVNAIPQSWKTVTGLYQFFSDSTNTNQNVTLYPSTNITGNIVKLGGTIGKAWAANTTYVRRVFSMIKSPQNVQFYRLTFDGNKANASRNISWTANNTILGYGYGDVVIDHCTFINIPNENIVGQGLRVTNNNATSLNGSFVHLSAEADRLPVYKPTLISGNITNNTSMVNTGHSEGAITNSFTPGFVTITDNRFYNGNYSGVFGYIQSDSAASDGAYKNVVIAGNYAEGFSKIFYYISILPSLNRNGHIFINGNTFNNCGINDWMPYKDSIDKYTDSIMIGNNMLVGGTVWKVPIQKSDSLQRYIINNATGTPQNAFLNISRSATIGDTLSVGNIPTGAITDSVVTTKNKSIRKISFSDLGYMPTTGGQFTGDISFSNNKILYGRLTDFTPVSMLQVDNTNALNYGNMSIPYSYFYTTNDFTFYNNPSVLKRFAIRANGHILMGNLSDNGADWLQVGGTINSLGNSIIGKTETTSDSSNNAASTAFVKRQSASKLDTSYRQSFGLTYPLRWDSVSNRFYIAQSYLDSLAAKYDTVYGSQASGGNLNLFSTRHATKGYINFGANSTYDEVNKRFGINTLFPRDRVDINGTNGGSITFGGGNGKTISAYQNGVLDALWFNSVNTRFSGVLTIPSNNNGGNVWVSNSDGTNPSYTEIGNTSDDRFYMNVNGHDVFVSDGSGNVGFGAVQYANSAVHTTSFATEVRAVGSTYTVAADDHTINCVTGTFTVTLPSSIGIVGREYVIANSSPGTITIATTASQKFKNVLGTPTTLTLVGQGSYKIQASADSNWIVETFNAQGYAPLDNPAFTTKISTPKITGSGTAPTVAVGSSFTGTATVTGTDVAGEITLSVTGSTSYATLAELVTLTFHSSYTTTPYVVFTPSSSAAGASGVFGGVYLKGASTTGFSIATVGSGTSNTSTYKWTYHVIQ